MNFTINIKNTSHRMPYTMTIGPYTRKHDAIKGLASLNLPNLKNAKITIDESRGNDVSAVEVVTKMTPKSLTTIRFSYLTHKEEGESTYKFDY